MNDLNLLHFIILAASGVLLLALLAFLLRTRNSESGGKTKPGSGTRSPDGKPCPLCGEILLTGERVHSVLYPGKPDSLMEIHGCRYCEGEGAGRKRICPVCKKEVPSDGVVIARVFEKPGKKHVHVLGCSGCYSGRTKLR